MNSIKRNEFINPVLGNDVRLDEKLYEKKSIALFYNYAARGTTGAYVKKVLDQICKVRVFYPAEAKKVTDDFDLYLVIDDSSHYVFPRNLKPSVLWIIDTHLTLSYDFLMAMNFDFLFCAQREGASRFVELGFKNVYWLPLACDPEIHHHKHVNNIDKIYDVGFVGNVGFGFRKELLDNLKKKYLKSFIGKADYTEMGEIYAKSRIVFNRSINNDLNMRVFEGMCSGSALLTDRAGHIETIFSENEHLFLYGTDDEAMQKIDALLNDQVLLERVASKGLQIAMGKHTYTNRIKALLHIVFNTTPYANRYKNRVLTFFSKSDTLQRRLLKKRLHTVFFLPFADYAAFKEELRNELNRSIKSAMKRLRAFKQFLLKKH